MPLTKNFTRIPIQKLGIFAISDYKATTITTRWSGSMVRSEIGKK